jgi:hypothetical protein
MKNLWDLWMDVRQPIIDAAVTDAEKKAAIKGPDRKLIAEWVVTACGQISHAIIHNSWRHGKYSYFPQEQQQVVLPAAAAAAAAQEDDDNDFEMLAYIEHDGFL